MHRPGVTQKQELVLFHHNTKFLDTTICLRVCILLSFVNEITNPRYKYDTMTVIVTSFQKGPTSGNSCLTNKCYSRISGQMFCAQNIFQMFSRMSKDGASSFFFHYLKMFRIKPFSRDICTFHCLREMSMYIK
jgi:hypothetical protein